jgi:hypothetical protein
MRSYYEHQREAKSENAVKRSERSFFFERWGTPLPSLTKIVAAFTGEVQFPWPETSEMKALCLAIDSSDSSHGSVRYVDTEFQMSGPMTMEEVAVLGNDGKPLLVTLINNEREISTPRRQNTRDTAPGFNGCRSMTIDEFASELPRVLKESDFWVEWSNRNVDHDIVSRTLVGAGLPLHEISTIMPPMMERSFNAIPFVKRYLSHLITTRSWRLQYIFAILFPQHPLRGYHHEAWIDAHKMFLVLRVVVQLFKPPEERVFSPGFLNNLLEHLDNVTPLYDTNITTLPRNEALQKKSMSRINLTELKRQKKMDDYISNRPPEVGIITDTDCASDSNLGQVPASEDDWKMDNDVSSCDDDEEEGGAWYDDENVEVILEDDENDEFTWDEIEREDLS